MAFKFFLVVLLFFIVGNYIFFLWNQQKYWFALPHIRKALYSLFVGGILLGLLTETTKLSNSFFLLSLTALIVFIDLSLLLTPSILKLWKAEFEHTNYLQNVVITNKQVHQGIIRRVQTMSSMIQQADKYFKELNREIIYGNDELEPLKNYLRMYTDNYGLSLEIKKLEYPFPEGVQYDASSDIPEEEFFNLMEAKFLNQSIIENLEIIENTYNLDFEGKKETYALNLLYSEVLSLSEDEIMIVPVLKQRDDLLIVLSSSSGELYEVDALHVTNLTNLFYLNF